MDIRFTVTPQLELTPRRVSVQATILALTVLTTRTLALREAVPERLQGLFDELSGEAREHLQVLQAQQRREGVEEGAEVVEDTLPLPESLKPLADEATLRASAGVNHLLDSWVSALANVLEGTAIQQGSRGEDARALLAGWFGDGRAFLRSSNRIQWLEIHDRWGAVRPEDQARLDRLGLAEHVQTLAALNAWFGQLLHITRDTGAPVLPAPGVDPLPAALRFLTYTLLFANVAWPGDDAQAVALRQRLAGPYIEEVQRVSAKASALAKQRASAPKEG